MKTKTYLQVLSFVLAFGVIAGGAIIFNGELSRQAIRDELNKSIDVDLPSFDIEVPKVEPKEYLPPASLSKIIPIDPPDGYGLVIWPTVFTNPDFEYKDHNKQARLSAIADGLLFWVNVSMGFRMENKMQMEIGLEKIGKYLLIDPTIENLQKLGNDIKEGKDGIFV